MRIKRPKRRLLPLLCYAAALLVWLGVGAARFAAGSAAQSDGGDRALAWDELRRVGFEARESEPGLYVSTDPDPQIYYEPEAPFSASALVFEATARNKPGGEMVLYYRKAGQQGYPESQKLWACRQADGSWRFDLPGSSLSGLRLDPDSAGGVLWKVEAIRLEASKPAYAYFLPDARGAFLLLFLPGLAAAVLLEGLEIARLMRIRRKAKAAGRIL